MPRCKPSNTEDYSVNVQLELSVYLCIVAAEANRCSGDKPILLTAESSMIFGAAMLFDSLDIGTAVGRPSSHNGPVEESDHRLRLTGRRCSWQVRAAGGQRVVFRLSVYRPAGRFESGTGTGHDISQQPQSTGAVDVGSCPWTLIVDDGETNPVKESLCWLGVSGGYGGPHSQHTGHRAMGNRPVECKPKEGLACSIHLDWPDDSSLAQDEMPIFVLHYEGLP